jgi:enoyl-CoA hydratase
MGRHSPLVIRKMLNLISDAYDKSVDGFANEIDGFGESFATDDFKEGTTAFLEKRAPRFTGR